MTTPNRIGSTQRSPITDWSTRECAIRLRRFAFTATRRELGALHKLDGLGVDPVSRRAPAPRARPPRRRGAPPPPPAGGARPAGPRRDHSIDVGVHASLPGPGPL